MLIPMSRDIHILYQDYEMTRLERVRYLCDFYGKSRTALFKYLADKSYYDLRTAQKDGKEIVFC